MKRFDDQVGTGHLLAFISREDPKDNFSFFFPITGFNDLDRLYRVIEGFQSYHENIGSLGRYQFQGLAVNDIGRVIDVLPEIDEKRLCRLDLSQFIDERGNFVSEIGEIVVGWFSRSENLGLPAMRTGSIATGQSFFDRDTERELIWKNVTAGKNILLQSPRRYGKTSLLKNIQQTPLAGWMSCYVDVQDSKSVSDFLEMLVGELMMSEDCASCMPAGLAKKEPWKAKTYERSELKRKERQLIKKGWREYGSNLFTGMFQSKKKLLLIFDEFSYMLEEILGSSADDHEVDEFMAWFADIRSNAKNICFILSGSEHLETFLRRHSIDGKIDDLTPVPLVLFDDKTALSLMFLLFIREGIAVEKKELDDVLRLIGEPIPYFLQVFVDLLASECRRREELTIQDIENLYYAQLLGADGKRHFESIEQQLDRYGHYTNKGKEAATRVLSSLSWTTREEVSKEDLKNLWSAHGGNPSAFDDIFDLMKDDFYINVDSQDRVAMNSKLIRDWWVKYAKE